MNRNSLPIIMSLSSNAKVICDMIEKSKRPLLLFDVDTDGTLSYFQIKKKFPKILGIPFRKDEKRQDEIFEILEGEFDLVLLFDIPFLEENFFQRFPKGQKFIWVDHHPSNNKELIEKYSIITLNPLNYDKKDNRPTCYLSYIIANDETNIPMLAIGSISDFYLLPELEIAFKKYNNNINSIIKISDEKKEELLIFLKKYKFNDEKSREKREEWIRHLSYDTNLIKLKMFFDTLYKKENFNETIKALRIVEKIPLENMMENISAGKEFPFDYYDELLYAYQKRRDRAIKKYTENEKIFIYEYTGEQGFSKTLSEELIHKLDLSISIVCFLKKGKEEYQCSARSKGIIINTLIQKSLENLSGSGGGHPFATGFRISKKDITKFKKIFLEELGRNSKL